MCYERRSRKVDFCVADHVSRYCGTFLFRCKFHSLHPKVDPPREQSTVWYIPKSVLLSRQFFGAVVDMWNDKGKYYNSKILKTQLVHNNVMNAFPSRDPVVLQLLRLMKKMEINDLYLLTLYEDLQLCCGPHHRSCFLNVTTWSMKKVKVPSSDDE